MTETGFLYDPAFLEHRTPAGHPESPRRLERIIEHLDGSGALARLVDVPVTPASRESLLAVHHAAYIDRIERMGTGWIDPDTYCSPGSWNASLLAAGAVCRALDACRDGRIARAFCAVRPPGHHAEPARGMGFCLLNNAAVGARHAQRLGYARVMVADFDVHHGNGTQAAFYDDDSVFYFSTHEYPHYPGTGAAAERGVGRGAGFTRNVPLSAGAGDAALRQAWEETFRADAAAFGPDCCIVSAGYDLHEGDPLADLAVSDAGVRGIVRGILEACAGIPVVFTLEGGYNLATLARCVGITVEELLR
jgi:acetoin utilization deacetylase AcuC-like enzyme